MELKLSLWSSPCGSRLHHQAGPRKVTCPGCERCAGGTKAGSCWLPSTHCLSYLLAAPARPHPLGFQLVRLDKAGA
eukprot:3619433-Amphidinium_carterae.1